MWYMPWWQHAIFRLPFTMVCFHKWSKRRYVLAIGVVPINMCDCGVAGVQGRKWRMRWDVGCGDGKTTQQGGVILIKCMNARRSSLQDKN